MQRTELCQKSLRMFGCLYQTTFSNSGTSSRAALLPFGAPTPIPTMLGKRQVETQEQEEPNTTKVSRAPSMLVAVGIDGHHCPATSTYI